MKRRKAYMGRLIEAKVSPYIPLNPDLSAKMPVNGYFSFSFQYKEEEAQEREANAYVRPMVTLGGFVKEAGDTSAVFNTADEFSAFVDTLQFEDTQMYRQWTIVKLEETSGIRIVKKASGEPEKDFRCCVYSNSFQPTNQKGDDGRAVFSVKAENFRQGATDEYSVYSTKIYLTEILSFEAEKTKVEINENFSLKWDIRGDFIDRARLQKNDDMPESVGIQGNTEVSIDIPTTFKLLVENSRPDIKFSATAYLKVGLAAPEIKEFLTDRKYVYQKQKATLSWKASSAYFCQLDEGEKEYGISDSAEVEVDFGEENVRKYRLTASGYSGDKPCSVSRSQEIRRTYWKKEEKISGVELKQDSIKKGMFSVDGQSFLFNGKTVYRSKDGSAYESFCEISIPEKASLNGKYRSGYFDSRFYVAGIQEEQEIYIAGLDLENKSWGYQFLSDVGEKCLNGCFVTDQERDCFYYVFYIDRRVYIFRMDQKEWGIFGAVDFSHDICALDGLVWRDNSMRLSLIDEKGKIRNYEIEEDFSKTEKKAVIQKGGNFVSLIGTENQLLVMGQGGVYQTENGKCVDTVPTEVKLTGITDTEELLCQEGDKLWRYRLTVE